MQSAEIVFHPEAAEEYMATRQWYGERGEHLAVSLEHEIGRALQLIVEAPERWSPAGEECRRLGLRRFPYSIIYTVEGPDGWVAAARRRTPGT